MKRGGVGSGIGVHGLTWPDSVIAPNDSRRFVRRLKFGTRTTAFATGKPLLTPHFRFPARLQNRWCERNIDETWTGR